MRQLRIGLISIVLGMAGAAGMLTSCATAPKSAEGQSNLQMRADQTVRSMMQRDPGLGALLQRSAGYAVFPEIGKGGLVVGGAHGKGILYERGRQVGFISLSQASIGAQVGGQAFSEIIVFQNPWDVARVKSGKFQLTADASAVALTAGAAAGTVFRNGVAVFVVPRGGAMASLAIGGQKLDFQPMGG
jgi:lipid-binding SYLF domain-containing protein